MHNDILLSLAYTIGVGAKLVYVTPRQEMTLTALYIRLRKLNTVNEKPRTRRLQILPI